MCPSIIYPPLIDFTTSSMISHIKYWSTTCVWEHLVCALQARVYSSVPCTGQMNSRPASESIILRWRFEIPSFKQVQASTPQCFNSTFFSLFFPFYHNHLWLCLLQWSTVLIYPMLRFTTRHAANTEFKWIQKEN